MATGRFRPKDLKCKTHHSQPRYSCTLCDQAIKALVDKLLSSPRPR